MTKKETENIVGLINTLEIATLIVLSSSNQVTSEEYKILAKEISEKVFDKARFQFVSSRRSTVNDEKRGTARNQMP
jgi:hypothetical protein